VKIPNDFCLVYETPEELSNWFDSCTCDTQLNSEDIQLVFFLFERVEVSTRQNRICKVFIASAPSGSISHSAHQATNETNYKYHHYFIIRL
jgi:hypothetical protein